MNLRAWLRKAPYPTAVMVGKTRVTVPDSRTKWAEVEQTILVSADDGDKIVCLDREGTVLRAFAYDGEKTEGGEKPSSVEASETVLIARELNSAADNAAKRHEAAYSLAFCKIVELCTSVMDRLASMEATAHDARLQEAKARAEMIVAVAQAKAAGGDQSDFMAMLGPMMPGVIAALGGAPPKSPNGKS